MYRSQVRMIVGLGVVVVHLFSFSVIMFFKSEWASMSQRIDLALVLMPVTATYFMAVVKSAVDNQRDFARGDPVNINYVSIVVMVTGAFLIAVVIIVISVPSPVAPTVDDAKKWLVGLEVGLGASFGYIASDLFGKIEQVRGP